MTLNTVEEVVDWLDRSYKPERVKWLADKGYVLFEAYEWFTPRHEPPDTPTDDPYPHAYMGGDIIPGYPSPICPPLSTAQFSNAFILYAQDVHRRHVVLKLVKRDSDEWRIAQILLKESKDRDQFRCVVPILDLLEYDESTCYMVMPRWGQYALWPWFSSMEDILFFIHSMLKGLDYLHRLNIAHRDIKRDNILVNHFIGPEDVDPESAWRYSLRNENKILYAICDFDVSLVKSPSDEDFAQDIESMGEMISVLFQHLTPQVSLFAPLFDGLLARRFTAAEALAFYEEHLSLPGPWRTITPYDRDKSRVSAFCYDRWRGLPAEFVERWAEYRLELEPPEKYQLELVPDDDPDQDSDSAKEEIKHIL